MDGTFVMLLNAHHEVLNFVLPSDAATIWQLVMDTSQRASGGSHAWKGGHDYALQARSAVLLEQLPPKQEDSPHTA